jgi:glycosyltransferase involved in cell wall biosynthesis
MRIMIVTDQYPPMVGGVPTVTYNLGIDLANRGHQVSVIAPSYGVRDVRRIEQKVHVYRFSSFEWPTYKEMRIPFLPLLPLRNLIKKIDPDIIHIHSPVVLGNIAHIHAGGLHKPVIATNHYLPINLSRSLASEPFIGKHFCNVSYSYLVYFCNGCQYVTAPTKTALNLLYEHGLHAPARAISNGIDLQKFTPGERDPQLLQRFGLPTDRPLLLHVNRLSEEKRVDVLLDAVAKIKMDAHLALVSTGPAEADLRLQVKRLGIVDRVSFLGFVSDTDLLVLRRSADLFVIPSEADLQSLSTMEAMACGLCVIAANAYALPELVHHEENGFLFQPGDSDELAQKIDQLLSDEDRRARMGEQSLKIIAAHDRIKVLDEWEEIYHRLAIEFKENKERRQYLRIARKYSAYKAPKASQTKVAKVAKVQHSRRRLKGKLIYDQTNEADIINP